MTVQVIGRATQREQDCFADTVSGSLVAGLSGVTAGIVLAAITHAGNVDRCAALGAAIGVTGGLSGALVGRIFERVLVNSCNNYLNLLAGAFGGAAFLSSVGNLAIAELTGAFPSPLIQVVLAFGGAGLGGMLPLACRDPRVNARVAAGIGSLGVGTGASIGLGALLTTKLYPDIGILNGMEWGLSGITGLLGYLLPPRPTPNTPIALQGDPKGSIQD